MKLHTIWILVTVLGCLTISIGLYNYIPAIAHGDSDVFEAVSSSDWRSWDFWMNDKPPTTALVFQWQKNDGNDITLFFQSIAMFSWCFLAYMAAQTLQTKVLKVASWVLILGMGISEPIFFWNRTKLSESLAVSGFILLIALLLYVLRYKLLERKLSSVGTSTLYVSLTIIFFFWSLTRDSNAYTLIVIAALLAVAVFFERTIIQQKLYPVALISILLLISIFHTITSDGGVRWQFPLVNVIGQRILPDDQKTNFFAQRDMPMNENVTRFKNKWAPSYNWTGFGTWLPEHGKSTYTLWLISHPILTLVEPWQDWKAIFDPDFDDYMRGYTRGLFSQWQRIITAIAWPSISILIAYGLGTVFVLLHVVSIENVNKYIIASIAILVLVIPTITVCWHGDSAEVSRHCLGAAVTARIGIWLALLFCIDASITPLYNKR